MLQDGEDLGESGDLLLNDLTYNVCHQQKLQDSYHAVFNEKNIDAYCVFAKYVLNMKDMNVSSLQLCSLLTDGGVFALNGRS